MTFNEYEEFIYLNTTMSREEARAFAREMWNAGKDKYEALKEAN